MARSNRRKIVFRVVILLVWTLLFGMLLRRDYFIKTLDVREALAVKKGKEESFSGIYFRNERIGYVKNRLREKDGDGFQLDQEAYLVLNILEQSHPVRLEVKASLDHNMLLRDFNFSLSSPFYNMQAEGMVEGTTVSFTLSTGKDKINDSIKLAKPPFLSTDRRSYLIKQEMNPGEKIKIPYFDPISLTGKDTILEYKGFEKVLIKGRIHRLHHFTESFSGMRINSWLDDSGKVIKEESPSGFVFIAEPEFKATDISARGQEILSSVSVPLSGTMPNDYESRPLLRFRLTYPEEAEVTVTGGRQKLEEDLLAIRREKLPETSQQCSTIPEDALASTPYVQTKNKEISKVVNTLVNDSMDSLARVKAIAAWVYKNVEKRPVLGIPDAVTTLNTMRGDCNEHAALFAAMARNGGIPTRIVAGVTFHNNAFYYHAWNEICLGEQWISLDTTKNQLPADITHIRFVEGETREQIRIGGLLGRLKIEVVP